MIFKIIAPAILLLLIGGFGYFALVDVEIRQENVSKTMTAEELEIKSAD